MRNELIHALKQQAERLLMVIPGTYEFTTIEFVNKKMRELYDYDCRNPEIGERGKRLTTLIRHWMETCAWVLALDPLIAEPDPASYGILRASSTGGVRTITMHCADYDHFKSFPPVVLYKGERYARVGWSRDDCYCWYRTGMALANGVS